MMQRPGSTEEKDRMRLQQSNIEGQAGCALLPKGIHGVSLGLINRPSIFKMDARLSSCQPAHSFCAVPLITHATIQTSSASRTWT